MLTHLCEIRFSLMNDVQKQKRNIVLRTGKRNSTVLCILLQIISLLYFFLGDFSAEEL